MELNIYKIALFSVQDIPHDQQCKNALQLMGTSLPVMLAEGDTGKILKSDLSRCSHVLCRVLCSQTIVSFSLEAVVVSLCKSLKMRS